MDTVDAIAKPPVGGVTGDLPTNPPPIKSIQVLAVTPSENPYAVMMNFPVPTTMPAAPATQSAP
jgi:hypothetical protein